MVNLAHKHGAVAGLHSCGDIHQIIPMLIEMGMDAINPIQVSAEHMDPEVLKWEYGKGIVLLGASVKIGSYCMDRNIKLGKKQSGSWTFWAAMAGISLQHHTIIRCQRFRQEI